RGVPAKGIAYRIVAPGSGVASGAEGGHGRIPGNPEPPREIGAAGGPGDPYPGAVGNVFYPLGGQFQVERGSEQVQPVMFGPGDAQCRTQVPRSAGQLRVVDGGGRTAIGCLVAFG